MEYDKDRRVNEIGRWLTSGKASEDAIRSIAYMIERAEREGDVEIFISDEIDESTKN